MALRLPVSNSHLLAALLLAPATASAALVSAELGVDAGDAPATPNSWMERVQIRSGSGIGQTGDRPADLALRIVTPEDSERGDTSHDPLHDNRPGRILDGHPSPAITGMPAMAEALVAEYFRNFPDALPAESSILHFMAHEWALIQQGDRHETPEYRLDHLSFVEQRRADGTFVDAVSCSDGERSATLDQWQANDYALLRHTSALIAEACMDRLSRPRARAGIARGGAAFPALTGLRQCVPAVASP